MKPGDEKGGSVGAKDLEGGDKAPKNDLKGNPNAGSNLSISNVSWEKILAAGQCWMEFQR